MSRFQFVADHAGAFGVKRLCRVLSVSRSGYYRWQAAAPVRAARDHGIVGLHLRTKVRTTVPQPAAQKVADLLKRDFTAAGPNQRYVGDITYLPLAEGRFLYLATVIDLHSRRLAGWSIADHMRTELVTDALRAAAARGAAP